MITFRHRPCPGRLRLDSEVQTLLGPIADYSICCSGCQSPQRSQVEPALQRPSLVAHAMPCMYMQSDTGGESITSSWQRTTFSHTSHTPRAPTTQVNPRNNDCRIDRILPAMFHALQRPNHESSRSPVLPALARAVLSRMPNRTSCGASALTRAMLLH